MRHNRHKKIFCSLAVLAMLLSFLTQITPLWLTQSAGTQLLICTAFGTKTITIDDNGREIPLPVKPTNKCKACLKISENDSGLDFIKAHAPLIPITKTASRIPDEQTKTSNFPDINNNARPRAPPAKRS